MNGWTEEQTKRSIVSDQLFSNIYEHTLYHIINVCIYLFDCNLVSIYLFVRLQCSRVVTALQIPLPAYTRPAVDTDLTKGPCLFLQFPQLVWQQIRVSALLSCSRVHAHVHSFAPQGFSRVVRTDVRSVSAYFTLAVPAGGSWP